jgi:putative ABC transport system ATP-binding protein
MDISAERGPLVHLHDLKKFYRTEEVETVALAGVTFDIARGEFLAIMGPSGCGKTTLLNLLGLLDRPSTGKMVFDGVDVSDFNERRRAELRRGTIGFVFQSFNLIDELTVYENVELPLLYLSVSAKDRRDRVEAALDRVQMAHRRDHFPQQLSGGQQQRVAIARAVVASPPIILADEPTGNLDSTNGDAVMQLLTELNEAGTSIVMVTHSPADAEFAQRIIHLFDGQVVSEHFMEREYHVPEPAAKGAKPASGEVVA